jgi:molybdenum cofactor cytidylyltransferase
MKFGPVALDQAEGAILAHSVLLADGHRLRKGQVLDAESLTKLHVAGVLKPVVARLGPTDIHEDEAAARLATALAPDPEAANLRVGRADRGSVFIHATKAGVILVDESRILLANSIDSMLTIATPPHGARVIAGAMVGSIKTISYGVPARNLARAEAAAHQAIRVAPVVIKTATLIETVLKGERKFSPKGQRAVGHRMKVLGIDLIETRRVPHDEIDLQAAIADAKGEMILILTATATSDRNDIAPLALRRAGGKLLRYGMPVDPGHLLFHGELHGRPVIGLPGCARSLVPNGADFVIDRLACGLTLKPKDFARMGIGGLLKDTRERGLPRAARET